MKTGFLNNKCEKCEKYLGSMENYGTEENKLCYDCASKLKCASCGEAVPTSEQLFTDNKLLCNDCRKIKEYEEKYNNTQNDELVEIPFNQNDDPTELPDIQLPMTFMLRPERSSLIFITIVMLLPTFGGVLEAFRLSFSNLNLTHYICLLLYAIYPIFLYRIFQKRVILYEKRVEKYGFIFNKDFLINDIARIDNVISPKGRFFHWDKSYENFLFLIGHTSKLKIKIDQIKDQKLLIDYLVVKSNCPYDKVHKKRGALHCIFGG